MDDAVRWTCPFCGRHAVITDKSMTVANNFHLKDEPDVGPVCLINYLTTCPNSECRRLEIRSALLPAKLLQVAPNSGRTWQPDGDPLAVWRLQPSSTSKVFPEYVPSGIRSDYQEACSIRDLSPKASATLSRRALQGMIRDFWGVKAARLADEIAAIKDKVDPLTWEAIDAVRTIGNIGAHMEKDVNLIIDVDPEEAQQLIGLIEMLIADWYVGRHERQEKLEAIKATAAAKTLAKTALEP